MKREKDKGKKKKITFNVDYFNEHFHQPEQFALKFTCNFNNLNYTIYLIKVKIKIRLCYYFKTQLMEAPYLNFIFI